MVVRAAYQNTCFRKFNYQNITAEVSADSVKVINKNLFVNTDIFDCKVTVAKDGKVIRKASLATAVAPLSEEVYALPLAKEEKPGEYAVTVSFHLKEDKVWAEAHRDLRVRHGTVPFFGKLQANRLWV